jgi:hypothetical protein
MGDTKHNGIILQDIIHNFFSFLFPHEHQPQHLNAGWDDTQTCLAGTRQAEIAKVMAWVREKDLSGTEQIYFLADVVGSGKTALAHSSGMFGLQSARLLIFL